MSIARQVKISLNLQRLADTARRLGYRVHQDAVCYGYYSQAMENGKRFPLVIETGHGNRFQIGVEENGLTTDMHGGYVQGTLNQLLPAYYEDMATEAGFQVVDQTQTNEEIVMRISR